MSSYQRQYSTNIDVLLAQPVQELYCSYEEANTCTIVRIVLYTAHAANKGLKIVVTRLPDTDVPVMVVAKSHKIPTTIVLKKKKKQSN